MAKRVLSDAEMSALEAKSNKRVLSDQEMAALESGNKIKLAPEAPEGRLASMAGQVAQGATLGYMPQIAGGLAALVPGGMDYVEARDLMSRKLARNKEAYPVQDIALNIAGGAAIPVSKALSGAKTLGQAALKGVGLGGLLGLTANPGDVQGEINPIQGQERLINAGLGALVAGVVSPAAKYMGDKAAQSRLAQRLKEKGDIVQQELRDLLGSTEKQIRTSVLDPAEQWIQTLLKGKEVQLNPELIPSGTKSAITGRDVLGATKQKLIDRATKEVVVPGKQIDLRQEIPVNQKVQMPLTQQQNVSALPVPETDLNQFPLRNFSIDERGSFPGTIGGQEQMFNALNQAKVVPNNVRMSNVIPANTPKAPLTTEQMRKLLSQRRIDELTRSRGELVATMATPESAGAGVHIQESLPMREQTLQKVQGLSAPLDARKEALRMLRVAGEQAQYPEGIMKTMEADATKAPWENLRNILRGKLRAANPNIDPSFAEQEAGLEAIKTLKRVGGGVKSPISTFSSGDEYKKMLDTAAELKRVDRLLNQDTLSSKAEEIAGALQYGKPFSGNLTNIIPSAWNLIGRKAPGELGRGLGAGNKAIEEAYKRMLPSLLQERLRAIGAKE